MNGGSNTAAQNSQSNPTKQITPNFLGDSYARCPFALHSRQLRSKGTRRPSTRGNIAPGNVSSHGARTSGASFPPPWPFHRHAELVWCTTSSGDRTRSTVLRLRSKQTLV